MPTATTAFNEQFRAGDTPFLSPERVCDVFGFRVQELADLAQVQSNTIKASPQAKALQDYLQGLLAVLQLASNMTGDLARAAALLRNEPLRVFDGKTAVDLIRTGRVEDVMGYLRSVQGGAAG